MKTKIIDEKRNPLFDRKEVILEIESEITPSHTEAEEIVSEKFKTSPEAFKIKKIQGNFGSKFFKISANIYSSKEGKEDIEVKTKKGKMEQKSEKFLTTSPKRGQVEEAEKKIVEESKPAK